MIRLRWLLLVLLSFSSLASAQFTTVTGTVLDPNSIPYSNGTITAILVSSATPIFTATNLPYAPPTQPVGLNAAGAFAMRLADVTALTPGGSTWTFTVCSAGGTVQPGVGTGPVCFTVTGVAIAGASQDITATLHAAALALTIPLGGSTPAAPPNSAQYNNAGALGGVLLGAGQFLTGTGAAPTAQSKAVIDVRDSQYGAIPDGATDNATAIAAAFTAANAVTTGSPTVYFGCNSAAATCEYNYSGAGTSPINPTIPMTIACAPNVLLNYTGTAHAVDVGSSGLAQPDNRVYEIKDCQFTGGASYTQGIFINNFIVEFKLIHNTFKNFGNTTGAALNGTSNNWFVLLDGNTWINNDGSARNAIDFHLATNAFLFATGNHLFCISGLGAACSVSGQGYGVWARDGFFASNQLGPGNMPMIRISSEASGGGAGMFLFANVIEGNTNAPTAAIEFGDPGAPGNIHMANLHVVGNSIFWPVAVNISTVVTNQVPASSSYFLDSSEFRDNFVGPAPTGTGKWFNTNGGIQDIFQANHGPGSTSDLDFTVAALTDSNKQHQYTLNYRQNNQAAGPQSNYPVAMDSTGHYLSTPTYHGMTLPFKCNDSSGSGTAQICATNPQFDSSGAQIQPGAGDCLIYSTTTTNTGALTLAVNGAAAASVKKRQGTVALAAGDLVLGHNTWICYDGTQWDLLDPITQ